MIEFTGKSTIVLVIAAIALVSLSVVAAQPRGSGMDPY